MSNVATIGVRIVADATKLQAGLQKALDAIDSFGNKFQRAANKVAAVGAAITAVGAKLIADAAKYDGTVKAAVDRLGNAYDNLAVRLGSALVPAINAISTFVGRLVAAWDSLSSSQRKAIADIALLVAKILVFVGVAGAAVGIIGDIAGLAAVLLPVLVPVLAIAAGLAGIALLLGAGYGAWKEYGDAVTSALKSSFDAVAGFAGNYFVFMADSIRSLANFWLGLAKTIVDANKAAFATLTPLGLAGVKNPILESASSALDAISAKVNGPSGIGAAIRGAGDSLLSAGKTVVAAAGDGIKNSLKNFTELTGLDSIISKFSKMFDTAGAAFADKLGKVIAPQATTMNALAQNMGGSGTQQVGLMSAAPWTPPTANTRISSVSGPAAMGGLEKIRALENYANRIGETFKTIGSSLGAAGMSLVSRLGKFGAAVQAGIQGFQSGGIWGAIIAVFAELISGTQAFQDAIDIANGAFKEIAGAFEGLVSGIQPLLTAITMVISSLINLLEPLLSALGESLGLIAPILGVIALLLDGLAPLFEILGMILKPLFSGLKVVVDVISVVLAAVIYAILKVVQGIVWVWNTVVDAIANFVASIGLGDLANSIRTMRLGTEGLQESIDSVSKVIQGGGKPAGGIVADKQKEWLASGKVAAAGNAAASALDKVSESLTNIPQGFKVAAARFAAMAGGGTLGGGSGGDTGGGDTPGDLAGWLGAMGSRGSDPLNITLAFSGDTLMAYVERKSQELAFKRTGSRARP